MYMYKEFTNTTHSIVFFFNFFFSYVTGYFLLYFTIFSVESANCVSEEEEEEEKVMNK